MSLLVVGTVAFDAIETPFGKTDKIIGGAATYISLAASYFKKNIHLVSVVGDDFPEESLEMLKKHPKLIVLDTMNFWMDIAMEELVKTISMVDVLTVNDAEARQLSGEYSLVKAAQKILAMGPKVLIIKKGEHGALLFNKEQVF